MHKLTLKVLTNRNKKHLLYKLHDIFQSSTTSKSFHKDLWIEPAPTFISEQQTFKKIPQKIITQKIFPAKKKLL
jgi:hypothetical protein